MEARDGIGSVWAARCPRCCSAGMAGGAQLQLVACLTCPLSPCACCQWPVCPSPCACLAVDAMRRWCKAWLLSQGARPVHQKQEVEWAPVLGFKVECGAPAEGNGALPKQRGTSRAAAAQRQRQHGAAVGDSDQQVREVSAGHWMFGVFS